MKTIYPNLTYRSTAIRARVEDALNQLGHGNIEAGKCRFLEHAIWCAERKQMRLWKKVSPEQQIRVATRSLNTLLGEVGVVENGKTWTGRNKNWVLDIWEVALDDWFYIKEVPVVGTETFSASEICEEEDARQKSLSLRILEAYIKRDDNAMIDLAEEVEALS